MFITKSSPALIALCCIINLGLAQTPTADQLVGIHILTQTEINSIVNPIMGTLVYNSDIKAIQAYEGSTWQVPESISTFIDNGDGTFTYTNEKNESITIGTIGPQGPQGPPGADTVTHLSQDSNSGVITYLNENNDVQTANLVSSDTDNIIKIGSDGGTYLKAALIDVYDANNGYTIANNSYRKIRLNTVRVNHGGVFTIANNEVTVTQDGTYEIEYGVATQTNAQARTEAKLRINGVDMVASQTYDGGWYKKVTATRKLYAQLQANDVISVWARRTQQFNSGSNSVTTIKDGSYLVLKKLD